MKTQRVIGIRQIRKRCILQCIGSITMIGNKKLISFLPTLNELLIACFQKSQLPQETKINPCYSIISCPGSVVTNNYHPQRYLGSNFDILTSASCRKHAFETFGNKPRYPDVGCPASRSPNATAVPGGTEPPHFGESGLTDCFPRFDPQHI